MPSSRVSDDEYRFTARLGMSQSEAADYLGVSRAAVTKAKQRLGLVFAKKRRMPDFWPETMERDRTCYLFKLFWIGDCIRVTAESPAKVAWEANLRCAPMRFTSRVIDGVGYVARAA